MGYHGRSGHGRPTPITNIPQRAERLLPETARLLVDDGTDFMLTQVKINTPVSEPMSLDGWEKIPGGDGIHLREEIHRTPFHLVSAHLYAAEVGSDKEYAPFVEEGTGLYGPKHAKYLIMPHDPAGSLRWPGGDGQWHFAKHVWHPGSPGQHMFLIGGHVTEMSQREWTDRGLRHLRDEMR